MTENRSQKSKSKYVFIFFLCSVLCLPLLTSCTVWHPVSFKKSSTRPGLPDFYAHYYEYPKEPLGQAEIILEKETDSYRLRRIEIPLTLPPELTQNDLDEYKKSVEETEKTDKKTAGDLKLRYRNRIDLYIPKNYKAGEKRPLILISPILGGNMVVDHFAAYYAGRGYLAAIVHRKRPHWENGEGMIQIENYMRISVIRLRQALDWLLIQPEVDPERVGAFGVSYGAILHTVLAAVDDRIRYHVLAMPGAPLPDVITKCPDKAITKMIKKAHEENGWSREQIYEMLQKEIKTDPILVASFVPKNQTQIYIALFDRVVGVKHSFRLWKALGKPKMKILPFGHYGGVLVFPYLQTQSYVAFKKHLKK